MLKLIPKRHFTVLSLFTLFILQKQIISLAIRSETILTSWSITKSIFKYPIFRGTMIGIGFVLFRMEKCGKWNRSEFLRLFYFRERWKLFHAIFGKFSSSIKRKWEKKASSHPRVNQKRGWKGCTNSERSDVAVEINYWQSKESKQKLMAWWHVQQFYGISSALLQACETKIHCGENIR